jgi:hypothetical protein
MKFKMTLNELPPVAFGHPDNKLSGPPRTNDGIFLL